MASPLYRGAIERHIDRAIALLQQARRIDQAQTEDKRLAKIARGRAAAARRNIKALESLISKMPAETPQRGTDPLVSYRAVSSRGTRYGWTTTVQVARARAIQELRRWADKWLSRLSSYDSAVVVAPQVTKVQTGGRPRERWLDETSEAIRGLIIHHQISESAAARYVATRLREAGVHQGARLALERDLKTAHRQRYGDK